MAGMQGEKEGMGRDETEEIGGSGHTPAELLRNLDSILEALERLRLWGRVTE